MRVFLLFPKQRADCPVAGRNTRLDLCSRELNPLALISRYQTDVSTLKPPIQRGLSLLEQTNVSKAWDPDDIFDVLASEDVRRILVVTSVQPMSAKELADICDRSLATVYRRIQAMKEYDLLSEEPTRDPDGTQYNEYRSELNEITIGVDEGQLNVNIDIQRDTVDQFAELIEDLEQSKKQANSDDES